jgi:hypothetical protein
MKMGTVDEVIGRTGMGYGLRKGGWREKSRMTYHIRRLEL